METWQFSIQTNKKHNHEQGIVDSQSGTRTGPMNSISHINSSPDRFCYLCTERGEGLPKYKQFIAPTHHGSQHGRILKQGQYSFLFHRLKRTGYDLFHSCTLSLYRVHVYGMQYRLEGPGELRAFSMIFQVGLLYSCTILSGSRYYSYYIVVIIVKSISF